MKLDALVIYTAFVFMLGAFLVNMLPDIFEAILPGLVLVSLLAGSLYIVVQSRKDRYR